MEYCISQALPQATLLCGRARHSRYTRCCPSPPTRSSTTTTAAALKKASPSPVRESVFYHTYMHTYIHTYISIPVAVALKRFGNDLVTGDQRGLIQYCDETFKYILIIENAHSSAGTIPYRASLPPNYKCFAISAL